jgi:hypothetical protein
MNRDPQGWGDKGDEEKKESLKIPSIPFIPVKF